MKITTKSVNKAVLWDRSFSMRQGADESAKEYIHKCQQAIVDCDFQCPSCNCDLSDNILVNKLVNGLYSVKLKQDVLQNFEKYDTITKFMITCESFEETERECALSSHRGDIHNLTGANIT